MNLVRLGDKNIEKLGEKLAMVFEGEEFTNTRLNEMGRRMAGGLKSLGLRRGNHVAVYLPNSPEVFACFQGIWRIGAVIIPIMFLLGIDEIRYILKHSDATAIITSKDLLPNIEEAMEGGSDVKNIIVLGGKDEGDQTDFHGLLARSLVEEESEEMAEDDLALMIYTSGTTGRPKGASVAQV